MQTSQLSEENNDFLWVIEDDIHSFLTTYYQHTIIPPFQKLLPNQTIYLAGMTKFICSGLRVAYLVAPVHVQSKIEQAIFNINMICQIKLE